MKLKKNDKLWKALKSKLNKLSLGKSHVRVGCFGGTHSSGFAMPELMAVHEFGNDHVPQRSFIGSTLTERREEAATLLGQLAGQVVEDKLTPEKALGQLGLWAATAVKEKIVSSDIPPPLAASTVRRKGSSKPLVDTGQMLNSITWIVVLG